MKSFVDIDQTFAGQPRELGAVLSRIDTVTALLDAAADLDARATARTAGRRAFVATLTFAGLQIHEAAALTWRDVDLARGRITVGRSKTDAGIRIVDIVAVLQDELTDHRSTATRTQEGDFVFPTSSGSARDKDNARTRPSWPAPTSCWPSAVTIGCRPA